jgi:membrane associated rhomboid family serine protease
MIPISDENPTLRTPVMTWLILGAIFAVWFVVQGGGLPGTDLQLAKSVCNYGMIPGELTGRVPVGTTFWIVPNQLACQVDHDRINLLTPLTSMFLHGGWAHILGNAIFFWVFGNNVEDSMGPVRFLAFYLICGLVAAAAQVLLNPTSAAPTVGASGAISGVLGAYLVLYPKVRIHMLFIFIVFFKVFRIPAWIVLVYWFGIQVVTAYMTPMQGDGSGGGVAVWAHIGGFVSGMLLIKLFERRDFVAERNRIRSEEQWMLRSA